MSWCLWGALPSPLPCSLPPGTVGPGHTGEGEISSARQFWGVRWDGVILLNPPGQQKGWEG